MPNGMGYKILTFIKRVTHLISQGLTFQAAAASGGLAHSENTVCESLDELHAGYFCTRSYTLHAVLKCCLGWPQIVPKWGWSGGSFATVPSHSPDELHALGVG